MKKIWKLLLLTALLVLILNPVSGAEDNSLLRGYSKSYQYVLLGEYPYEKDGTVKPVLWKILSVEDGTVLMMTDNVIDLQQVVFFRDAKAIDNHKYPKLYSYADSDLCKWMNTEMLSTLFGQDPIANALLPEGENGSHGKVFCLSAEQFVNTKYGFRPNKHPAKVRIAAPTPYARARRVFRENKKISYVSGGSPYWTCTRTSILRMQIVGYDGHLSAGVFSRENIGVRPGIRLDLNLIDVESGSGTQKDPFILKYTGDIQNTPTAQTIEPETEKTAESVAEEDSEPDQEEAEKADDEEKTNAEVIPLPDGSDTEEDLSNANGEAETESEKESSGQEKMHSPDGKALVTFLGDCSIGDALQSVTKSGSYHSTVDKEGYAWPFSMVQKYLGTDDMTVANLEVVVSSRTSHKNIVYPLHADPDHVNILTEGSIDVLNTANNHCYDFFRDGYVDTLTALNEAGIEHFGSVNYTRKNGFDDVLVKDVNGIRFGMIGFTYPTEADLKHAEQLIKKLREEDHCDYIIASLHWGRETYTVPGQGNVKYAKKMLDRGADMIYGHHPHVLQPIAFHNNKPILFSTGNCTFGTLSNNMDQHAGIFQITFEKTENGVVPRRLEVIPCKYYKSGDYRIEEETDEAEREKTFKILSPGRNLGNCVNPPDSFLKTGVILFNEAGELIADQ